MQDILHDAPFLFIFHPKNIKIYKSPLHKNNCRQLFLQKAQFYRNCLEKWIKGM